MFRNVRFHYITAPRCLQHLFDIPRADLLPETPSALRRPAAHRVVDPQILSKYPDSAMDTKSPSATMM